MGPRQGTQRGHGQTTRTGWVLGRGPEPLSNHNGTLSRPRDIKTAGRFAEARKAGVVISATEYLQFEDKGAVGKAVVERLRHIVAGAVRERGVAHLVLTGGSMGEAVMRTLAADLHSAGTRAPDWSEVHLWWGDERYLPAGHPDRNDTQADDAGLSRLTVTGDDLAAAASSYASELRRAGLGAQLPAFDVVMLGMGPDGHVASLFPDHPSTAAAQDASATVVPVQGAPKPPPRRLSMSLPTLCSGREVWIMVAGADKAPAVRRAEQIDDPHLCPAGAVRGRHATIWWLDDAAAHGRGGEED